MFDTKDDTSQTAQAIRSIVHRIESLVAQLEPIKEDIRDIYTEAKARGFDPKTIRAVVAYRRKDPKDRAEEEAMFDLYLRALSMRPPQDTSPTPLERAAAERESAHA